MLTSTLGSIDVVVGWRLATAKAVLDSSNGIGHETAAYS